MQIEESVYLSGTDGPRRTVQIVIYGNVRDEARGALELPPHAAADARRPPRPRGRAGIAAVNGVPCGCPAIKKRAIQFGRFVW